MLEFLKDNWFPLLCATIITIFFIIFLVGEIVANIKIRKKTVNESLEKSKYFKKYDVEEIDVKTLQSKNKKIGK